MKHKASIPFQPLAILFFREGTGRVTTCKQRENDRRRTETLETGKFSYIQGCRLVAG
jgi:hypothetical protein